MKENGKIIGKMVGEKLAAMKGNFEMTLLMAGAN